MAIASAIPDPATRANFLPRLSFKDRLFDLLLAAIGIAIPIVVISIHLADVNQAARLASLFWSTAMGALFLALAAGTCSLNLYTSLIRPWLHFRKFGHMDSFRHVSGAPFVGGFFDFAAAVMLPPSWIIGTFLLLTLRLRYRRDPLALLLAPPARPLTPGSSRPCSEQKSAIRSPDPDKSD